MSASPTVSNNAREWMVTRARGIGARLLYQSGLTRPGAAGPDRLTVVTFHRVLPEELLREYPLPEIAVSEGAFGWFVDFFASHFTCGPLVSVLARWVAGERPERPLLAITFDDGQRDNFEYARPILERAGVRATFFVPVDGIDTGTLLWHDRLAYASTQFCRQFGNAAVAELGLPVLDVRDEVRAADAWVQRAKYLSEEDRTSLVVRLENALGAPWMPTWDGMMRWEEIRQLVAAGHEIGSHSMSHRLLTGCGDKDLEREVTESRRRVSDEAGTQCHTFCYPNGDQDERVVDAVRRAGYTGAVTTLPGPNAHGGDPLRLCRCEFQQSHAGSKHIASYRLSSLWSTRMALMRRGWW